MSDHTQGANTPERRRALVQSTLALMAGMVVGPGVLYALAATHNLGNAETAPYRSTAVLLASIVALGWGIWRARAARAGQFDGPGLLAMALMGVGTMSALTYAVLIALVWFGGRFLE